MALLPPGNCSVSVPSIAPPFPAAATTNGVELTLKTVPASLGGEVGLPIVPVVFEVGEFKLLITGGVETAGCGGIGDTGFIWGVAGGTLGVDDDVEVG